jgi:hypothetical protein
MKLGFSRQIYEKSSNIKFHENLSSAIPLRTDDEASSGFSQFCQHAQTVNSYLAMNTVSNITASANAI